MFKLEIGMENNHILLEILITLQTTAIFECGSHITVNTDKGL